MTASIAILKTGSTHPRLRAIFGDFEDWFQQQISHGHFTTFDIAGGDNLPGFEDFDGYIITGSPAMVTEQAPWSEAIKPWLMQLAERDKPLLAVCYGHQLLAEAFGGKTGWHPEGREIGTVNITLTDQGQQDALLGFLPKHFTAQVTHAQSALTLPDTAILLACNDYEPHQAFRIGATLWGIQFHPEFSADIMRGYIFETSEKLIQSMHPIKALLSGVKTADANTKVIQRFVELCQK